jgi:hypothetical protein
VCCKILSCTLLSGAGLFGICFGGPARHDQGDERDGHDHQNAAPEKWMAVPGQV